MTWLYLRATWNTAQPSEVFLEDNGVGEVERPANTLSRLFDLLEERGQDDYGAIDPTQYAFKTAYKLVEEAERYCVVTVPGAPNVDSGGGVRITWKSGDRQVRLVCPATKINPVYIYQESLEGHKSEQNVTAGILAEKLVWLISGGDIL
jgi:hypothetical protein